MIVISLVSWLLLEIVEAICCLVKLARNCAQICLIILKGKILPSCQPCLGRPAVLAKKEKEKQDETRT